MNVTYSAVIYDAYKLCMMISKFIITMGGGGGGSMYIAGNLKSCMQCIAYGTCTGDMRA